MSTYRIALANLRFPSSPEQSLRSALDAVLAAGRAGAQLICFPEAFVPGYRCMGKQISAPNAAFLADALQQIGAAAQQAGVAVVLGTERLVDGALRITAAVFNAEGALLGFQDKVQLDPSEDAVYAPGSERRIFETAGLTFGVSICHEGFRYPETVRWAARHGAQLVLHPHLSEAEPGSHQPTSFGEQANSFHEKAILCRAAENTCFVATVNCASQGSPTTSAVADPEGALLCAQPYGQEGLLLADLDLGKATLLLASRYRPLA
jgi:predicted amidohydrolase